MARGVGRGSAVLIRALAVLFGLIALAIGVGGVKLLTLGGSPYYLLGGIVLLVVTLLLWRRSAKGAALYALFLLVTLGWSLWEAGLDGWALAPRLIAPAILGLLFLIPGIKRSLTTGPAWGASAAAGVAALSLATLIAVSFVPAPGSSGKSLGATVLAAVAGAPGEWESFGRTAAGDRFSPLSQITPDNVDKLEVAWTYNTGVVQKGVKSPLQATPIMVGDSLYLCTQTNIVIALDPETGKEKWRFDPKVDPTGASAVTTCRGVTYYENAAAPDCPKRILTATFNAQLIAIDATTGKACQGFGKAGFVDLNVGMGHVLPGFYYVSSAPTLVAGNIVLGGWVADNQSMDEPSGVIRAFDAVTGKFVWAWDAGRPDHRGEPGPGEHYTRSTPNSWAPMSADEALGMVYVPTGNPAPDHWGAGRSPASEKYGSATVALDARTGAPRWSFQTAHHDLWDYDVASQPTLIDVEIGGRQVPALVQATKRGEIFLLDRRTGTPLAEVQERPAPQRGAAKGERLAPTQPFSVGMPSFAGPVLTERDMWGLTPLDQLWCRIEFKSLRYDGPMTPPGEDRSLIYPSIGGGMNWGGVAYDPDRKLLIVNSMYYGSIAQLVPRAETDRLHAEASAQMHNFSLPQPQAGAPYGILLTGLMSPLNAPCNKPPYGMLSAVDMKTRKLAWTKPIGSARDTGPFGLASGLPIPMGMPMFGGSMTTRSGLTFIGATQDRTFRAFDTATGKLLWSARLPAGGQANPMTYVSPSSGRQFVVISAGGHMMLRSPLGDAVVAYALPRDK